MTATIAHRRTRCANCPDLIWPGDLVVMQDDRPVHAECEKGNFPSPAMLEAARAFEDWKAVAFEHGDCFHGAGMDKLEASVLAAAVGKVIAEDGGFDPEDMELVGNIGYGFVVGWAAARHMQGVSHG